MNFNFKILSDKKKQDIKKNGIIFLLRSSIIDKRVRTKTKEEIVTIFSLTPILFAVLSSVCSFI